MSLQRYEDVVFNHDLTPVSAAIVSVLDHLGVPVSLFDENSNPIANPVVTDGNGNFFFYVPAGYYTLLVSGGAPPISPTTTQHITVPGDGAPGAPGPAPTGAGNEVLATPSDGSSGVSALRNLVALDIPTLPYDAAGDAAIAQTAAQAFATTLVTDLSASLAPIAFSGAGADLTGTTGIGPVVLAQEPVLSSINVDQDANGDTAILINRKTNIGPTGNFIDAQSASNVSLFTVDVTGTLTQGIIPEALVTNLVSDLAGKQASLGFTAENAANKDAASGYAGLTAGSLLKAAEFPTPTTSTFGGVKDLAAVSHKFLTSVVSGVPVAAQPAYSDISGTPSLATVATSGAYSDLTGKPTLAATKAATSHQWLASYDSTTGLFTQTQPAAADITGLATVATSGAYTDLSGLPTLAATIAAVAHKFVTSYTSSTGIFTLAQPDYSDLTGTPTLAATKAAVASNFLTSYTSGTGAFTAAQPAFTDISGVATLAQIPTGYTWDKLGNAGASLTLSNAAFTTEFDQTAAAVWLWKNTTIATVSTTNASPLLEVAANYWTGGASATDTWTIGSTLAAGTNAPSLLTIAHSGSSGLAQVRIPNGTCSLVGTADLVTGFTPGYVATINGLFANENRFYTPAASPVLWGGIVVTSNIKAMYVGYYTNNLWLDASPPTTYYSWVRSPITLGFHTSWATIGPGPFNAVQIGAACGVDSDSSPNINWTPTYGGGSLVGVNIAPIINQLQISNNITGVSLTTNVVTVGLNGANAYAAAGLIQVAAVTNTAINGTFTLSTQVNRAGSPYTITNAIENSSSVVTLTIGTHAVIANDWVYLSGLNTYTWLNGTFVKVTSVVVNTSITFTDPTTHGTQATIAQTGTVQDNYVTYALTHANIAGVGDTGTIIMGSTGGYTGLLINPSPMAVLPVNAGKNKYLDCQDSWYVNNIVESSGSVVTLTITGGNCTLQAGQQVTIVSLYTGGAGASSIVVWLQGLTVTLLSANATTVTFNDPTLHGTLVSTGVVGGYITGPSKFSVDTTGNVAAMGAVTQQTANGAQWVFGSSSELLVLSTSGLTTDTVGNLLPANAIIESVVARVTTALTVTTNWKLGDATIAGRFTAADATLTLGETQVGLVHIDQTGTSGPRQTAAAKVRVTCTGSNPGAGAIRITVFYRQFVAPTS